MTNRSIRRNAGSHRQGSFRTAATGTASAGSPHHTVRKSGAGDGHGTGRLAKIGFRLIRGLEPENDPIKRED
jgi:hypothetical protein